MKEQKSFNVSINYQTSKENDSVITVIKAKSSLSAVLAGLRHAKKVKPTIKGRKVTELSVTISAADKEAEDDSIPDISNLGVECDAQGNPLK